MSRNLQVELNVLKIQVHALSLSCILGLDTAWAWYLYVACTQKNLHSYTFPKFQRFSAVVTQHFHRCKYTIFTLVIRGEVLWRSSSVFDIQTFLRPNPAVPHLIPEPLKRRIRQKLTDGLYFSITHRSCVQFLIVTNATAAQHVHYSVQLTSAHTIYSYVREFTRLKKPRLTEKFDAAENFFERDKLKASICIIKVTPKRRKKRKMSQETEREKNVHDIRNYIVGYTALCDNFPSLRRYSIFADVESLSARHVRLMGKIYKRCENAW